MALGRSVGATPGAARCPLAVAFPLLAMAVSGCVAHAPRSHDPAPGARVVLNGPPLTFADDRCGPGSLAAVLRGLGDSVTERELDAALPKVRGGVLSLDLLLAARRRGFDAGLLAGDATALRLEIEADRPAILMLRLLDMPGQRRDIFHYVVADGSDPARGLFRVQFGDGKVRWVRLGDLETSWKAAGHALLRVSRSAPSLASDLGQGVLLEREGRAAEAAALYRQGLDLHPESVRLRVNLGNAEAASGRRSEAEAAFRAALALAPSDPDALNNLAWLLLGDPFRLEEAFDLASRAARPAGPDRPQALDTLGRVELARGRCRDAASTFEAGLQAEPAGPLRATLFEGLGQARLACGDHGGAQGAFEAALAAEPAPDTARSCRESLLALRTSPR